MQWPQAPLGEYCEIVSGSTPRTGVKEYWDGDIYWVTPKDLSELNSAYIETTARKITRAGLDSCSANILPAGSILFSSRAPIGLVAINAVPMCTNQGFKSLVPDTSKVHNKYLYHWLKINKKRLEDLGNGATFKEVSKSVVARVEIPLPSLPEQRRIAAILDKADSLREKRRQAIAKLDALLKSVFIEMFGDPIKNPRAWPKASLHDVSSKITDGEHLNPEFVSEGVPMIMAGNVLSTGVSFDDIKFIKPQDHEKFHRKCNPQRRDILFVSRGATIGRCTIVDTDRNFSLMGSVILVKPKRDKVIPEYLSTLLAHPAYQQKLYKTSSASAQQAIYISHVKNLEVLVPPLDLQIKFTSFYEKQVSLKQPLLKSIQRMELLFQSLQQRAFSGELLSEKTLVTTSSIAVVQHV